MVSISEATDWNVSRTVTVRSPYRHGMSHRVSVSIAVVGNGNNSFGTIRIEVNLVCPPGARHKWGRGSFRFRVSECPVDIFQDLQLYRVSTPVRKPLFMGITISRSLSLPTSKGDTPGESMLQVVVRCTHLRTTILPKFQFPSKCAFDTEVQG